MKKVLCLVVMLLWVCGVAWNGFAAPQVIKLAHVVNEKDGFHVAALKFKELIEAQSDITIELHPNADLGDERSLLEGMQIGTIDIGSDYQWAGQQFLSRNRRVGIALFIQFYEEAYKILDGPIGQELLDNLSKVGLKGLAYAERGFRNLTNSVRPVQTPEDMKGLKIRVMENPVYIDTFKALGANAVPMA